MSPVLLCLRRLSQLFRVCSVSEKETSSSPEDTRAAMRRSSSGSASTPRPDWPTKALRCHTSRLTPSSTSPQFSPVRPGTVSPVAASTASKPPKGAAPLAKRRIRMSRPPQVRRTSPAMGEPDQGAYRFFSARVVRVSRSRVGMP